MLISQMKCIGYLDRVDPFTLTAWIPTISITHYQADLFTKISASQLTKIPTSPLSFNNNMRIVYVLYIMHVLL